MDGLPADPDVASLVLLETVRRERSVVQQRMLELKEQGLNFSNFSQEQRQEFWTMKLALAYYNEVLHELEEDGVFIDPNDEEKQLGKPSNEGD